MSAHQATQPTAQRVGPSPRAWIARSPLLAFVVLAYALTWPFMAVDVLASWNIISFRLPLPLLIVEGYGPTFAALIVVASLRGGAGIPALLRPLLAWRVGWAWYGVAILGAGALSGVTLLLYALLGGPPLEMAPLSWGLLANVLLLFLVGGVLNGEEIGWRGFALPYLQGRSSSLVASLIVGLFWTIFHAPQFLINGGAFASMPPLAFLARTLAMAVLFTWVYNQTQGSLLIAYLLHASINTWSRVFAIDQMERVGLYAWLPAAVFVLTAVAVVAFYGPARLARRALPEQPDGMEGGAL